MRTMQSKQTGPPLVVPKQHQIFPEDPNLKRRPVFRQFLAQRHRLPVTPQQFPGRGLRTRLRKKIVFFGGNHVPDLSSEIISSHPQRRQKRLFDNPSHRRRPVSSSQQLTVYIRPFGIAVLNQANLPRSFPILDRLFSRNGSFHGAAPFIPYQRVHSVALRESFSKIIFVLPHTLNQSDVTPT